MFLSVLVGPKSSFHLFISKFTSPNSSWMNLTSLSTLIWNLSFTYSYLSLRLRNCHLNPHPPNLPKLNALVSNSRCPAWISSNVPPVYSIKLFCLALRKTKKFPRFISLRFLYPVSYVIAGSNKSGSGLLILIPTLY